MLLSILCLVNKSLLAHTTNELDVIEVYAIDTPSLSSLAFSENNKASDHLIKKEKLQQSSATLGNALSSELGIHSNPYGSGSSAPVIRGQEGVRIKILQNGLDVVDMSTLSPDHVIAVDTLLANQVELVRGASTLLHSIASPAGVINIVDERIPTQLPEKVITGEALLRFNSNNDEKIATSAVTFPLGNQFALRLEGLTRQANPYEVPAIKFGEILNYLPDSHNKSNVGSIGLSWIANKGYLGIAYSLRRDQYGLIGHNHKFEHCVGHIYDVYRQKPARGYLAAYPHLMDDGDLTPDPHFHCGTDYDLDPNHSHDHPYGHVHDHTQAGPWVDLKNQQYTLQGEWQQPASWIDKLHLNIAYSNYHHEEHDHGKIIPDPAKPNKISFVQGNTSYFDNQGLNSKLLIYRTPTEHSKGIFGIQYQSHKNSALIPSLTEKEENRRPLVENTHKQFSIFGVEQYKLGSLTLESGIRYERTKIPVHYNLNEFERLKVTNAVITWAEPDLSTYQKNALSYAFSALWDINPDLRLDFSYSHNERVPTPMELYYHGKNLATNTFLFGNKNLDKEVSDNYELGIRYNGDKWQYKASIYHNDFDNYIHAENLHKDTNLYMRRFTQSQAHIHGLEGEISYLFTPYHQITIFGDYVRGRLFGFKPIYGNTLYSEPYDCILEDEYGKYEDTCYDILGIDTVNRPSRNAPRMSPLRLGMRLNNQYNDHWSSSLEYTRVFTQNHTSTATLARIPKDEERLQVKYVHENATQGYHLLNAGIDYNNTFASTDYTLSLRANNLLNEKVYIHNSFLPYVPQMGRNISISFNMKF